MIKRKTPLVFLVIFLVTMIMWIAMPGRGWGIACLVNIAAMSFYLVGLGVWITMQENAREMRVERKRRGTEVTHER